MNSTLRICIGLLACCTFTLHAEKRVGGIIDKDTKWSAEDGPFIVTDDILVSRNARLAITPGTTVMIEQRSKMNPAIQQFDKLDSSCISIRILGALNCAGRPEKRITFSPINKNGTQCIWYGLILDRAADQFTEMSFIDVAGAYNGITASGCKPLVRNAIIEYNTIGINCLPSGSAKVYNSVIAHNFTAGIHFLQSNPEIVNSIIVYNRNNGVWCDGISKMKFEYNCVYGNGDGNFMECDPEYGILLKEKKKGALQTDYAHNIFANPVFAGSIADSTAVEHDTHLQTDKSRVKDTTLAKVVHDTLSDSLAVKLRHTAYLRYTLSRYSPCVNAGNPAKQFRNTDETRNTMGIYGGPEFLAVKEK